MNLDQIREIFHFGWTYGYYQDDEGSCNPYLENSNEYIVHQLGYLIGLKDSNVKLNDNENQYIMNNIGLLK